jgi:neutral ceramidase
MRVRAASADITPDYPASLGGLGRSRRSSSVSEPLEINIASVVGSADGDPMLLVSIDALYAGPVVRRLVEDAFRRYPPERIFLAASHTHTAPMVDGTKPGLGQLDDRFLSQLADKLATVSRDLDAQEWRPCQLSVGTAVADHSINRRRKKRVVVSRRPRFDAFVNAPNPSGARDESVITLVARDGSGRATFVIWNYACHPVAFPDPLAIASNFPGPVRDELREHFEERALPVLYFQGFSGNTRPSGTVRMNGWKRRLRRLWMGTIFSDFSWPGYREWSSSLADVVLRSTLSAVEVKGEITASRSLAPVDRFATGSAEKYVSFHSVSFGDQLCIAGVGAEVVAEYAPLVRAMSGAGSVMCVGCIDHTIGYIPTRRILEEGGYEAGGYCAAFDLEGVASDVQEQFLSAFSEIL